MLVGGFAASDWLFSNLQTRLAPRGLSVCRPDGHVYVWISCAYFRLEHLLMRYYRNKAVADGALSFYLDHFVSVRVAKFSYGIECCMEFCNGDAEHQARYWKCLTRPSGREFIPGAFSEILAKVISMSVDRAHFVLTTPRARVSVSKRSSSAAILGSPLLARILAFSMSSSTSSIIVAVVLYRSGWMNSLVRILLTLSSFWD